MKVWEECKERREKTIKNLVIQQDLALLDKHKGVLKKLNIWLELFVGPFLRSASSSIDPVETEINQKVSNSSNLLSPAFTCTLV